MGSSQSDRLLELLSDYEEHDTIEILNRVYGGSHLGLARVGARIYDLKKRGYQITGSRDRNNPSIYIYRLMRNPDISPVSVSPAVRPFNGTSGDLFISEFVPGTSFKREKVSC